MSKPKRSMRNAINAFCKECIYDPYSGCGTWRQQVGACISTDCPLYAYRPMPETPFKGTVSNLEGD